MKKYIIILISFFLLLTGCSNNNLPQIEKENKITDGITFKTEYEKENSISLYDLSINKENPFKYINKGNIDSAFSNDSIIYIGSYNDLCSRLLVDQLIVFSKENNIKNIYYFNPNANSFEYKVLEKEVTKTKEESDLYKSMVLKLNDYLSPYFYGSYETSDKRFDVPTLIIVKDGKIVNYYNNFESFDNLEINANNIERVKNDIYNFLLSIEL